MEKVPANPNNSLQYNIAADDLTYCIVIKKIVPAFLSPRCGYKYNRK